MRHFSRINLQQLTRICFASAFVIVGASTIRLAVLAGGGSVSITQLSQASAGHAVQIKVSVRQLNSSEFSVGEPIQLRVLNALPGQVCDSPQIVTDGNGEIYGNCWSPVNGDIYVAAYLPNRSLEESLSSSYRITFGSSPVTSPVEPSPAPVTPPVLPTPSPTVSPTPSTSPSPSVSPSPTPSATPTPTPTPTPVPQAFILTPSRTSLNIVRRFPNFSATLDMRLKDAQTGVLLANQRGIVYQWLSSNPGIVSIAEVKVCLPGILRPCPNLRGRLRGVSAGSAVITVNALRNGQVLGTTTVPVTVRNPR